MGHVPLSDAACSAAEGGRGAGRSGSHSDRTRDAPSFRSLLDIVAPSEGPVPSSSTRSLRQVRHVGESRANCLHRARSVAFSSAAAAPIRASRPYFPAAPSRAPTHPTHRRLRVHASDAPATPSRVASVQRHHGRQHRPLAALLLGLAWRDRVQPSAALPRGRTDPQVFWNIAGELQTLICAV